MLDLDRRITRLERRNRLLSGLLAVSAALTTLVAARGRGEEVLAASRFELVDDEGRVRAELAIDEDGSAGLFLRDEENRVRGYAVHDDAQTGFFALDEAGTVRLGAAQFAHGGGGFALHGPDSKGAAVLYLKGDGSLTFYGDDGSVLQKVGK